MCAAISLRFFLPAVFCFPPYLLHLTAFLAVLSLIFCSLLSPLFVACFCLFCCHIFYRRALELYLSLLPSTSIPNRKGTANMFQLLETNPHPNHSLFIPDAVCFPLGRNHKPFFCMFYFAYLFPPQFPVFLFLFLVPAIFSPFGIFQLCAN